MNDKSIMPAVPSKSESTSVTAVVGVSNWAPEEPFGSCRSMNYTVDASSEPGDHFIGAEPPEAFAVGSVRALKDRLRSRVSGSSADHDSSGDF